VHYLKYNNDKCSRNINSRDNAFVISQLTNSISVQNEEAIESNNLCCKKIERQIEQEEKKKDRTKKIPPAIINML
jgi:hypothetical protein